MENILNEKPLTALQKAQRNYYLKKKMILNLLKNVMKQLKIEG
jgi:hypothetical protein